MDDDEIRPVMRDRVIRDLEGALYIMTTKELIWLGIACSAVGFLIGRWI